METQKTNFPMEPVQEEIFEHIIKIGPAFDKRNKGCGINSCTMWMVFKGSKGSVNLSISTAWYLPCTREWKEMWIERQGVESWEPRGLAVSYCSKEPLHDWQQGRENCDWIGCTCYGDTNYSLSDDVFPLLLTEGSDAVFNWLKNYYYSVFNKTPV